jgi:hypothetical protein
MGFFGGKARTCVLFIHLNLNLNLNSSLRSNDGSLGLGLSSGAGFKQGDSFSDLLQNWHKGDAAGLAGW